MSDYTQVSGGDQTAVAALPGNYSDDLILPTDIKFSTSTLGSSLSDAFPVDGTYGMGGSVPGGSDNSPDANGIFKVYNFGGGTNWYGWGTAIASGGVLTCDPTSTNSWSEGLNDSVHSFFALQTVDGIHSDDQFVQCEIDSVRTSGGWHASKTSTVTLVARAANLFGAGSLGTLCVVANFIQSAYDVLGPTLVVGLLYTPSHYESAISYSFVDAAQPLSWYVNFTGSPFVDGFGGGATALAPGDTIRLEVTGTNYNVIYNGSSIMSGSLASYGGPLSVGTTVPNPLPNSYGGENCGVIVRDNFTSGSGSLGVKNFACGSLGDPRSAGTNTVRPMPQAQIAETTTTVSVMDTQGSTKFNVPDQVAKPATYSTLTRMADSPISGISSACVIGDKGYFLAQPDYSFGHRWGALYLLRYDPILNKWTELSPPPIPTLGTTIRGISVTPAVSRGCIKAHDGLIYLVATTPIADLSPNFDLAESFTFVYDPNADSWSSAAPMPQEPSPSYGRGATSVQDTQGVIVGGKFYFPGGKDYESSGFNGYSVTQRNAVYDINSDTWADETPLPYTRGLATMGALGSDIFLLGGVGFGGNWDSTIGKYDTIGQTWSLRSTRGDNAAYLSQDIGFVVFDMFCVPYGPGLLTFMGAGQAAGMAVVSPDGTYSRLQTTSQINNFQFFAPGGDSAIRIGDYLYGPAVGRGDVSNLTEPSRFQFFRLNLHKLPWVI